MTSSEKEHEETLKSPHSVQPMSEPAIFSASNIRCVRSFEELISTPFGDGINALCWPRELDGDYADVLAKLDLPSGITHLAAETLRALPLSEAGHRAVETMLADHDLLTEHGILPTLDGINGYVPLGQTGPLRTDVCSWHVDSATCEADTWLCTYHGASSEGLPNEQVIRHVDVPETRAKLLQIYGGSDDEDFIEWLNDHFYDLHYLPLPHAQPFRFGIGHLWRVATLHEGCPVPPCVHRAPDPIPGEPRLLLIA